MIELIAKDKNSKFQFEGRCKLTIDSVSKLLLIEPFNEEHKIISALFHWKFIAKANMLFVFAERNFQDFVIIFDKRIKNNKIFDILTTKGATTCNKEIIQERFLPQLFKQIVENNDSKMKEIIFNWIKRHTSRKEKDELRKVLKDNKIYNLIFSNRKMKVENTLRKRKADSIASREKNDHQNLNLPKYIEASNFTILKYVQNGVTKTKLSIFPSSENKKYCFDYFFNKFQNSFICQNCYSKKKTRSAKIIKRNEKDVIELNITQHVCQIQENKEIIEKHNFQLLTYFYRQDVSQRLIIFLDPSRSKCYEYAFSKLLNRYFCYVCLKKASTKRLITAEICQKEEDGTEFVMLNSNKHVCEICSFNPEKFRGKQIFDAPNFKIFKSVLNGNDRSKLVVFTSSEHTTCYIYYWSRKDKKFMCSGCVKMHKNTGAEVCQNEDGSSFLKLSKRKHLCDPCKYDPDQFENEIVENSNFKIFHFQHRGEQISRLIVFCPTNKSLCYEYYWTAKRQCYLCRYCPMEASLTATVCQNDGKNYLVLSKAEHVCALREFYPKTYKDDITLDKSMYILTTINTAKILIIFTTEEKKFYYKFVYKNDLKYFFAQNVFRLTKSELLPAFKMITVKPFS